MKKRLVIKVTFTDHSDIYYWVGDVTVSTDKSRAKVIDDESTALCIIEAIKVIREFEEPNEGINYSVCDAETFILYNTKLNLYYGGQIDYKAHWVTSKKFAFSFEKREEAELYANALCLLFENGANRSSIFEIEKV